MISQQKSQQIDTPLLHVPLPRNPRFTGREALLLDLGQKLRQGHPVVLLPAPGLAGGTGKTQLALEYVYRHAGDYTHVLWLPAGPIADFAPLVRELGLWERDERAISAALPVLRRWLEEHRRWLLVLDDADAPTQALLSDLLPQKAGGHVLITSEDPGWAGKASVVSVPALSPAESLELLGGQARRADPDPQAVETLAAIAEALGHQPLLLDPIGAYLQRQAAPAAECLARVQKPGRDQAHALLVEHLEGASPAAAALLRLCSFLSHAAIPVDLLAPDKLAAAAADRVMILAGEEGAQPAASTLLFLASVLRDRAGLTEALLCLSRHGLATLTGDHLYVPRPTQERVRGQLPDKDRGAWAEAALRLVHSAFPQGSEDPSAAYEPGAWALCSNLLGHGLSASEHVHDRDPDPEIHCSLLCKMGRYLRFRRELTLATSVIKLGLEVAESRLHHIHPLHAYALNQMGYVFLEQHDPQAALPCYKRALEIFTEAYGPEHLRVAEMANNLGCVLQDTGDLGGARRLYERALSIQRAGLVGPDPRLSNSLANLGCLLLKMDQPALARPYLEEALAMEESLGGPKSPRVAPLLSNLGHLLRKTGDLHGARAYLERALPLARETFGPDDANIGKAMVNLGQVYRDLGDLRKAKMCFGQAYLLFDGVLGAAHPLTLSTMQTIRKMMKAEGQNKPHP